MSKSRSPYICRKCGLPVRVRAKRWHHMVNATTRDRMCDRPDPMRRSVPGSHRALVVGETFGIWRPAGEVIIGGTRYAQRFHPGSFNDTVSTILSIKRAGREVGAGLVIAAEVAPDGSGVTLTVEVLTEIPGKEVAA